MNFVQNAFKAINLQDDSLYDFLYDMVLFIGLKKSEEDIKNGRVMTIKESKERMKATYEYLDIWKYSWQY